MHLLSRTDLQISIINSFDTTIINGVNKLPEVIHSLIFTKFTLEGLQIFDHDKC
jgi:hypothetical protein